MSKIPRIMIAAPKSGSGKTIITCGILQAFKKRGLHLTAFKCGPDYIDPMFHKNVIGTPSYNLDTYFTRDGVTNYLLEKHGRESELSILEGVMGFYDGLRDGVTASSWELSNVTKTPVVLVVDAKGMSTSILAEIYGYLHYQEENNIVGVILNRISKGMFQMIKGKIESELNISVLGYLEENNDYTIQSRHLGLVLPNELPQLQNQLSLLAEQVEETVDLDRLLQIASTAPDISQGNVQVKKLKSPVHIGIAMDEAFCFYYKDNLELLEEMGAVLHYFSPCHDRKLPESLDGLLLGGGYPEVYAKVLNQNQSMIESIQRAVEGGLVLLAECGGFMYLKEKMQDMHENSYSMAGVLPGECMKTNRLLRFGYIQVTIEKESPFGPPGTKMLGHEFHYSDCTENGRDGTARKPLGNRSWSCMEVDEKKACGFPHFYYYSNPEAIYHMLNTMEKGKKCQ